MFGLIGIGVCVVFSTLVFFTMNSLCLAAHPYRLGEVNYFFQEQKVEPSSQEGKAFDFREPSIGVDGTVSYYTPPSPMLTMLETPTPQNARAYLAWQKERMNRIIKAQQVIDEVLKTGQKI